MEINNPELLCYTARSIIADVAGFIEEHIGQVAGQDIETKSLNSLVSFVDKTAEERLVAGLGKLIPKSTFLTEEETVENTFGKFHWIIDPLDGTTNFLHQLPFFSISVALQHKGETILGIVHEVNRQESFYAWKGGGAWLNNQPIQVSSNNQFQDALIATGFPYYDYSKMVHYFKALDYCMRHTRGIRRLGSAALDLAYVACGRFDAYFEYSLNAWDIAAGAFIVKEAGGLVCDFDGENKYLNKGEILAASSGTFEKMKNLILETFI